MGGNESETFINDIYGEKNIAFSGESIRVSPNTNYSKEESNETKGGSGNNEDLFTHFGV
jgi:hypothetical protein